MTVDGTSPWGWLGRPLALDLANTVVPNRGSRGSTDLLATPAQLSGWLGAVESRIGPVEPEAPADRLGEVQRLREAVRQLLHSAARGDAYPAAAVAVVNEVAAGAAVHPVLDGAPGAPVAIERWTADRPSTVALARVARSAIQILAGDDRERVRVCEAPACEAFHLIVRTEQHWCSTACGNRARAARFSARRRSL